MQKIDDTSESKKEPLIACGDPNEPDHCFGFWTSTNTILKLTIWPIIGMIFHPMYQLVNAAFVGHMEEKYLAGLGLGSLTTGIMVISIASSFALVTGSLVAPAYGNKEIRFCKVLLYRQMLLNTIVFALLSLPIFFI